MKLPFRFRSISVLLFAPMSVTPSFATPQKRTRRGPYAALACANPLRKPDGMPLDHNPIDSFSMDRHRNDRSGATTYWVRGGELLNVWIARVRSATAL